MIKPIDKEKVKIKHLIHVEGSNYPTKEDLLYEVVYTLQDLGLSDKDFKGSDIGREVKARINKMQLSPSIQLLVEEGWFTTFQKNGSTYFRLIKHPWE